MEFNFLIEPQGLYGVWFGSIKDRIMENTLEQLKINALGCQKTHEVGTHISIKHYV